MQPVLPCRHHALHLLSILLCCTVLLVGAVTDAAAQDRSAAWKERAQRSRQQYEQYMERQRDQILAFARRQGKEYRAAIERAHKVGLPIQLKNNAGEVTAELHGFTENGLPLYVSSTAETSAEIIDTKQLWNSPWNLTGYQEKIGRPVGCRECASFSKPPGVRWGKFRGRLGRYWTGC